MISKFATKEEDTILEKKSCFIRKYLVHFQTAF